MPRRKHHYEECPHCEGTGIKQFFHNVGDKIKQSFQKGGVMRKVGSEVLNVAKPFVRPVVNDLVQSGKTAAMAYAPELAPAIELGSKALQGGINKQLSKQGMGVGGGRKGRFVKGSQEAKDHMAKIRAMRGRGIGGKNGMYVPQPPSRMP